MKCEAKTEQEMRDIEAPMPETAAELVEYIESLVERDHDYGTCCYAMSLAATAAFMHVAHKLGVTGFQAGCADLDVLRRTRRLDGPFIILKAEDMLYPQYDLQQRLREAMNEWGEWAAKEAQKKLEEHNGHAHPDVLARWERLAASAPNVKVSGLRRFWRRAARMISWPRQRQKESMVGIDDRKFEIWTKEPNERGLFEIGVGKYVRFNGVGADKFQDVECMNDMRRICDQRAAMLTELPDDAVVCVYGLDGNTDIPAAIVKEDLRQHERPNADVTGLAPRKDNK